MAILINAISARLGGGQTYLANLLKDIPESFHDDIYVLDNGLLESEFRHPKLKPIKVSTIIVKNPFLRAFWEFIFIPKIIREKSIKLYFVPGGLLQRRIPRQCKTLSMCRNMLPFDLKQRKKYPISYMRLRNWILEKAMKSSFERTDHLIFVSKYAQKFMIQKAHLSLKASTVISHGTSELFYNSKNDYSHKEKYLLYVSTIDVYKGQIEVATAFANLLKDDRYKDLKLILVGTTYKPYYERLMTHIHKLKISEKVALKGQVRYKDLPAMYSNAVVNLFASECENCPNILLEAMSSGRPVLCSDAGPMPEFGGDGVMYFDPTDPATLLRGLKQLLSSESLQNEFAKRALEITRARPWNKTSDLTWNLIGSLASEADKCCQHAATKTLRSERFI